MQHQLAYHYMQLFCKHIKCEVKHNGIGDKALMAEMGGAFMTQMGGTVMAKGVTVFWDTCSKTLVFREIATLISSHHMTTGFRPFELPTYGLLQKG